MEDLKCKDGVKIFALNSLITHIRGFPGKILVFLFHHAKREGILQSISKHVFFVSRARVTIPRLGLSPKKSIWDKDSAIELRQDAACAWQAIFLVRKKIETSPNRTLESLLSLTREYFNILKKKRVQVLDSLEHSFLSKNSLGSRVLGHVQKTKREPPPPPATPPAWRMRRRGRNTVGEGPPKASHRRW